MTPSPYLVLSLILVAFTALAPSDFHMNELTQTQEYIQVRERKIKLEKGRHTHAFIQLKNPPFIFLQLALIVEFINESTIANHNVSLNEGELKLAFGLLTAIMYVAAFPGILLANFFLDQVGRKSILLGVNGVFDLATCACSLLARSMNRFELLFLARVFYGVEWGSQMVVLSVYISEICPTNLRGVASSSTVLASHIFMVLSFIIGLPQLLGTRDRWHYQFIIPILPSAAQFVVWFIAPESPKYLYINRNLVKEARAVLKLLYGGAEHVEQAVGSICSEARQCEKRVGLWTIFRDPALRSTMLLAICLSAARVTCGSLVLNQYSYILFTNDLGLSISSANYAILGVSCLLVPASIIGGLLIDRLGRRPLALLGLSGNTLLSIVYVVTTKFYEQSKNSALLYVALASIILMQVVLPMALALVTFFTVGEITTHATRSAITAFSMAVSTALRLLYFFLFPILQDLLGVYTMIVLVAAPSTVIAIYLAFELPETKRLAPDQVVNAIIRRKSSKVLHMSDMATAQQMMSNYVDKKR